MRQLAPWLPWPADAAPPRQNTHTRETACLRRAICGQCSAIYGVQAPACIT